MFRSRSFRKSISFIPAVVLLLAAQVLFAQGNTKKDKPVVPADAQAVLWREPANISSQDLLNGPWGNSVRPDLSNVTFTKDGGPGYSVKYDVVDGAGRKWVVKVGNEARPETAAVRLLSAVGYATEVNYLVPCVHIKGAPKPRKNVKRCQGDGFADVRFEARPENVQRLESWAWKKNPFAGTRELNGLVVLMALLNNWDLKDDNNKVLLVTGDNGTTEQRYIISDLGATFGKTGGFISHSRNEPHKYVKTKFIERVEGNKLKFAFSGKQGELLDQVTVEQAKWIGGLLAQLSDRQLNDAFRAANFTPAEVLMLTQAVKARIGQLVSLPG